MSRSLPHCFGKEDAALMLEFTSNKLESSDTAAHFRTVAGHLKYGACLGVLILLLLLNGSEMAHRELDICRNDQGELQSSCSSSEVFSESLLQA